MTEPDTEPAPASIVIQRRVEWSDTDASGAYHNSAAFNFMESAEVALVDRLGFREDVYGRHPRVRIEADFLAPPRSHRGDPPALAGGVPEAPGGGRRPGSRAAGPGRIGSCGHGTG